MQANSVDEGQNDQGRRLGCAEVWSH
jgi:hypothetical protein